MKFAIDRYITGLEREVCADDFEGHYIPRKHDRFFCPECGLQVFWVSRGGNQPNKFKHPKRTDTSPECDKRVDGRSELYLYERVGLPVYLSHLSESVFGLAISFPAIGSKMLAKAASQNAKVSICANGNTRSVHINTSTFIPDSSTLVPVNFLPADNGRYKIEVSPSSVYSRKWSNYAEGFTSAGAVFSYDEAGGRKIHRDDSIFPGRQYYVVARQFYCPFREVSARLVGSLQMRNHQYQVYCMTIDVSVKDEQRYSQISHFFRSKFGIGLLETPPEIIPLWPPVIDRDVMVPVTNTRIYCSITSGNDIPAVYSYSGNQVSNVPVYADVNDEKHIYVNPGSVDTVLSVDRKYVGREVVFRSKDIPYYTVQYTHALYSVSGDELLPEAMGRNCLSHGGSVLCNAKADLYLGSADHNFLHIPLRAKSTPLPSFQNYDKSLILVDGGIIYSHTFQKLQESTQDREILNTIAEHYYGELIPAPRWVQHLLDILKRQDRLLLARDITKHIINGRLPAGALASLEKLYRAVRSTTG